MPEFPVPQETIEAGLLSAVDQNLERLLDIEKFGITEEDFVAHRSVYSWMREYLKTYSALPTNSQINSRFSWNPPVGEFRYWLTEMRRYTLAQKLLKTVHEVYNLSTEPEKALSLGIERFSNIRATMAHGHVQASDSGAPERLQRYYARQEYLKSEAVMGIKTGLKVIDDTKQGWMPGELVGVYGRPGVGKTWLALWQAGMAWMQGLRVLAITPEMPVSQINIRIDVTLAGLMGYHLDYSRLLSGDASQEINYRKFVSAIGDQKRWWTYDSLDERPIGMAEITALVKLHDPQIVVIDGISLLRAEGRGQTWEQMKELSYGLKQIATINDIPFIITHQATRRDTSRKEMSLSGRGDDYVMPSLNDAAYGDAFVQACSTIITMVGDPNAYYLQWYSLRKVRERGWEKPLPSRMALAWEPARGRIIDLSEFGSDSEAVTTEAWKVLGRANNKIT